MEEEEIKLDEKIIWDEDEMYLEDESWERFAVAKYQNKLMSVSVNFKPNGLESRLKAIITDLKTEDKREVAYFYQRCFVGMGDEFYKDMAGRMNFKKVEVEMISREEDGK